TERAEPGHVEARGVRPQALRWRRQALLAVHVDRVPPQHVPVLIELGHELRLTLAAGVDGRLFHRMSPRPVASFLARGRLFGYPGRSRPVKIVLPRSDHLGYALARIR